MIIFSYDGLQHLKQSYVPIIDVSKHSSIGRGKTKTLAQKKRKKEKEKGKRKSNEIEVRFVTRIDNSTCAGQGGNFYPSQGWVLH